MRVETLEYGDDPSDEYPEDWNSFKIFTVWSEPDSEENSKRLATCVEFHITKGGYFFIERPEPGPDWLCKIFEMLKREGWQGHSLHEMRVECRGEIEIEEGDDWTAVIDNKKERAFHNRGKRKGSGKIERLEEFRS
ncbi:hypothetical protein [Candidatus Nanohalobium constans]|uniref:Uncharacterized protein n=1 Tax=Candidatus Nanohalobium constans TaxID=2565781 RepID=A0A5Q0UEY0_9ARCH|nr:hypothetical protein [Candidatus Nanohalobium constans]QGA80044.1 hypothetical protein LC1Nh_0136 [Candidatus Nanohalobium constans]